ncbi:DNA alkylation repair protein [Maridesulfovibrio sp. FT414]|uniref:DNA alkylation repair protein n=1 Tax=Maridesulfovibrio sp. FT414 TaxID=2979469 RepID=UPI003D80820D
MPSNLLTAIREELEQLADPSRAEDMQRYMKSQMPFYGIQTPIRRKSCHTVFKKNGPWNFDKWSEATLELWRNARYREERYAAIDLVDWKPSKAFHTWNALPLFEEIIVTGAWWDYCDNMASPLGNILRSTPEQMRREMLNWSKDDDMWKRRSSILCQLRFKDELDFDFLKHCIEPSIDSKEFFLRKGIGWALRDHAWTYPAEVKKYVEDNSERLSGLSKREALKNMHKLL